MVAHIVYHPSTQETEAWVHGVKASLGYVSRYCLKKTKYINKLKMGNRGKKTPQNKR
jgi:hypothetical protein